MTSAQTLNRNVLTVRQQVNNLKALLEKRQNELLKDDHNKENIQTHETSPEEISSNDVDSVKIISQCSDFQALLDQKLNEASQSEVPEVNKVIEKRPFLRKGQGLKRFYSNPSDYKLKTRGNTEAHSCHSPENSIECTQQQIIETQLTVPNSPLTAFELLEQKVNDSSFCSTSSLVTQLMDDSTKCTPGQNKIPKEQQPYASQSGYPLRQCNLDIIDEEPSKIDDSNSDRDEIHRNCQIILASPNRGDYNFTDSESVSSECTSNCSCQDITNFMSTSVSIYAEETSVFSPAKSETSQTFRAHINKACFNLRDCEESKNEQEMKSMLESQAQELRAEIEAFRIEKFHLNKLRKEYEKEYNAFCEERMQLLSKIREERLNGARNLEEERKKLRSEKIAFEKYMKDIKSRPTKQEREEMRLLKEEISLLKEEMNKKESRWGSSQARIRTEMKMLKDHNQKLQEELKELKKTTKKVTFAPVLKKSKSSPSINAKEKKEKTSTDPDSDEADKIINSILLRSQMSRDTSLGNYSLSDPKSFADTCGNYSDHSGDLTKDFCRSVCVNSYLSEDREDFSTLSENDAEVLESTDASGNREKVFADGRKEIWCTNGSVKKISADGQIVKIIYYNGDVEEILKGKVIKYYYATTKTWHTTFDDGDIKEMKEFPTGQIEKFFRDGSTEIVSPDGTICKISTIGEKEWTLSDGTIVIEDPIKNEKRSIFPNGEIEIHSKGSKRREYPNGTVKIVYEIDGRQETRYPNGRIRVKDNNGQLISDNEIT